ncbi:phage tail protein [Clostridium botulinum]|nr:phage tail protein [Clostridium botulinum]
MDLEKKSRSFQGKYLTYAEIFNDINKIHNAQMIDYVTNSKTIDNMIVQYNETDWEFLKRLASHFNTVLIPECRLDGTKYYIGDDGPSTVYELDEFNYSVNKGIKEYKLKSREDSYELNDMNFVSYEVVTNRILNSLTSVAFKGRKLLICKSEFTLVKGVLFNKYILKDKDGAKVKKLFNENISGVSLEGYILDVTKDLVKVSLKIDAYSNTKETTIWLPYSTVFSSPDGTGWYCMPEFGDAIRLYFPDNIESNAYAISSVNLQSSNSSKRNDPSIKSIGTKYGKEIIMRPGAIDVISGNNSMCLSDKGGISINSNKSISMSASSVNISGGYVSISGGGGVTISQNGAKLKIKDDIVMSGGKINTQ